MDRMDLDAIRKRCEATDGYTWEFVADRWNIGKHMGSPGSIRGDQWWIAAIEDAPSAAANAEFIAHAREDVPALLAEVERLHALSAEGEQPVDPFDPERVEAARARLRAGQGTPFAEARAAIRGTNAPGKPEAWLVEHSAREDDEWKGAGFLDVFGATRDEVERRDGRVRRLAEKRLRVRIIPLYRTRAAQGGE